MSQVRIVVEKMTWNSGFPGNFNFIIPSEISDYWGGGGGGGGGGGRGVWNQSVNQT